MIRNLIHALKAHALYYSGIENCKNMQQTHTVKKMLKNKFLKVLCFLYYRIYEKIISKTYFLSRRIFIKLRNRIEGYNLPDPEKVYWINPKRIVYSIDLNKTRIFDNKRHTERVIEGDWDISKLKFSNLDVFKAFQQRIIFKEKWSNTKYYKLMVQQIKSGNVLWYCRNKQDLERRFEYLDLLIKSIKEHGYKLSKDIQIEKYKSERSKKEEVTICIGRDGEYLFHNGQHRLAIAQILNIPLIPVKIVSWHKEWYKSKEKDIERCLYHLIQ